MPQPNGTAIRTRRQRAGLKLAELAEQARVKYQHLANIESGHAVASIEVLHRLARALDAADVTELVSKDETRPQDNRPKPPPTKTTGRTDKKPKKAHEGEAA